MRPLYPFILVLIILLGVGSSYAQYYHKDIWSNLQSAKELALLKKENLHVVTIKSFEEDGSPSPGFYCERRIDKNYQKSEMFSKSNITSEALTIAYYTPGGQLLENIDSNATSTNHTRFEYENGKIKRLVFTTRANDDSSGLQESHDYEYDASGKLKKMTRKKMNVVYSTVNFKTDDKGNVLSETEYINGKKGREFYYYYDDKNRLTDVVHEDPFARKPLPNYMYDYNALSQVQEMINTEEGNNNYYLWQYTYNANGLKTSEKCVSKEKRLLGSVEYRYR
jgi:hypothetical protein